MPLDIIFMGTPDFSVPVLDSVVAAGHRVVAVYSQPPRPAGRGLAEVKSAVHRRAEALGLPVRTPKNFKSEIDRAEFAAMNADAAVVVAYGLLLPKAVLDAPRLGCFNVHASKLPRWRGAAPIQRAIMAGDTVTAVNIMRMDAGLDTGPVCLGRDVPISPAITAGQLHDRTFGVRRRTHGRSLGAARSRHARSRAAADGGRHLRSQDRQARNPYRFHSRGSTKSSTISVGFRPIPAPGSRRSLAANPSGSKFSPRRRSRKTATPEFCSTTTLTIACGQGAIRIEQLQRAGKQPMTASDFLRGTRIAPGTRFA